MKNICNGQLKLLAETQKVLIFYKAIEDGFNRPIGLKHVQMKHPTLVWVFIL